MHAVSRSVALAAFSLFAFLSSARAQQMSSLERERALDILKVVASDVKKHYYDPKMHGVDFDAKIAEARKQIETANSFNMSMSHIAAALDSLDDTHTFFLPPQHAYKHSYGFQYQMVGNHCYVTQVRPKSDGESKGLKPGDEILALNGFGMTRSGVWKMQYVFSALRPQSGLHLKIQDPTGAQRELDVTAKMQTEKRVIDLTGSDGGGDIWDVIRGEENVDHLNRARYAEYGDLTVLKVPEFAFTSTEVESMLARARKHQNLIIDLRGNPGGAVETLKYLVGGMFDHEIKIADRIGRKETKPEVARPMHNPFLGKLVVLVDSRSASCAELFARIMQLENRGQVMGDVTAGAVMEARHYDEKVGTDTVVLYGTSITEYDLIMKDGKSLEHAGVVPDRFLVPNGYAISTNRDPVLAIAAQSLGVKVTPEEAGKAFPFEWLPQ